MLRSALGLLCLILAACAPANAAPSGATGSDPRFDAVLTAFPYPFAVHFLELTSQQQTVKMAYLDVAPEATDKPNGHTVVLLHGKNFGAYYWEPTIRF